jgi:hypothetical protein
VGAEFFHADGRTDTKLADAFRNYANAPKNDHTVSSILSSNKR